MKILIDVNLSPDWVPLLTSHVSEAVHWSAIGSSRAEDSAIVDFAQREGFIILTQDLDFGAILAFGGNRSPSVIIVRAGRVTPATYGMRVIEVIHRLQAELMDGAFVTIGPHKTRVTLLPLFHRAEPA